MSFLTIFSKRTPYMRYDRYDITAYVGKNGSGKTLTAVNDIIPTLNGIQWECSNPSHYHTQIGITKGYRNVLSSALLLDPSTRQQHALCVPFTAHSLLLVAEHSVLFLDEITALYPSRGYASLPPDAAVVLNQLRKADNKVVWTAPAFARADVILREVTEQVVTNRRFMPSKLPGRERRTYSGFLVRSYNGDEFKAFETMNRMIKIKPETYQVLYRPRKSKMNKYTAQDYYDTFAPAFNPEAMIHTGSCSTCGGRISSEKCQCTPHTKHNQLITYAKKFWANQLLVNSFSNPVGI